MTFQRGYLSLPLSLSLGLTLPTFAVRHVQTNKPSSPPPPRPPPPRVVFHCVPIGGGGGGDDDIRHFVRTSKELFPLFLPFSNKQN